MENDSVIRSVTHQKDELANQNAQTETSASVPPGVTNEIDDVATLLGIAPCDTTSSPRQRKRASTWFHRFLALSSFLDPIQLPNSFVNYQCVWWKAMAGNDLTSAVYDGGLAFDLLPPLTRWVIAPSMVHWYPRFHHANVEQRTRYLDMAILDQILPEQQQDLDKEKTRSATTSPAAETTTTTTNLKSKKIRLVLLGGGYDLRLIRMTTKIFKALQRDESTHNNGNNNDFATDLLHPKLDLVEVDLPHVLQAKQVLLQKRLLRRRPELLNIVEQIRFFPADLNDLERVQQVVDEILSFPRTDTSIQNVSSSDNRTTTSNAIHNNNSNDNVDDCFTIFVFEAVLIYLNDQIPSRLLSLLSQALKRHGQSGAVCFADTLSNVETTNPTTITDAAAHSKKELARRELETNGWILQDWMRKSGKTRHLGWALLKQ